MKRKKIKITNGIAGIVEKISTGELKEDKYWLIKNHIRNLFSINILSYSPFPPISLKKGTDLNTPILAEDDILTDSYAESANEIYKEQFYSDITN